IAAVGLWFWANSFEKSQGGGEKIAVLVAGQEIAAGSRVAKEQLAIREVPEAYVHDTTIRQGEENKIIGRPVTAKIPQGQVLLWSDFELQRSANTRRLSVAVPKGQRAITIPVDISGALGGMLRPGDHVDLMGTFAKGPNDWSTVTL